jgi:membrane associated rhomboid family serine protease
MRIPPATQALLWAMGIAFLVQQAVGFIAVIPFELWPLGHFALGTDPHGGEMVYAGFRPWQLLTYGFLHGGMGHLFFNALALYQFGPAIEQAWGSRRFAAYFLLSVMGSGVLQLVVAALRPQDVYPVVGASGGLYAVLLAYAMLFPHHRMMLLIPPIPMSARTMVVVFGALSLLFGITGTVGGIAHFVHLGGLLVGWLLIRLWIMPKRPRPGGPSTYV